MLKKILTSLRDKGVELISTAIMATLVTTHKLWWEGVKQSLVSNYSENELAASVLFLSCSIILIVVYLVAKYFTTRRRRAYSFNEHDGIVYGPNGEKFC